MVFVLELMTRKERLTISSAFLWACLASLGCHHLQAADHCQQH